MPAVEPHSGRNVLVSIHPEYVDRIVDGSKTVELRRKFVEAAPSALLFIYSTKPVSAVVGCATIANVRRMSTREIWKQFGSAACISKTAFDEYFSERQHGYAIQLAEVTRFCTPLVVDVLRSRFGFSPPQSFMYPRTELGALLEHERRKALN